MPSFDIVKNVKTQDTYRANAIVNAFDIDVEHIKEHFVGSIDIEDKQWNVGLIVGGSGTGKTTIAKECFGDCIFNGANYTANSVVDDMPANCSIKDIEKAFTSVGFASPPSWLKPYNVLSNGEKMRVDLAYAMLSNYEVFAFDEFTSVVNREVAKTTSFAIQKAIRKNNKKFIAISCHDDIVEWLQPDWVYNTDEKRFFFAQTNGNVPKSKSAYMRLGLAIKKKYGKYLEDITI